MAQTVADRDKHRVVGSCIVYRERSKNSYEYLVLRRRMDAKVYPGLWTVPAGGMERSDYENLPQTSEKSWENNPLQLATRREVMEEANVEVGELRYLKDFTFIRPDDVAVFGVSYAAPYVKGEAKFDPTDASGLAWITAGDLPQYEFLGTVPKEIRMLDTELVKAQ